MFKRWYQLFIVMVLAVCTHTAIADEYLSLEPIRETVTIQLSLDLDKIDSQHTAIVDESTDEGSAKNDYAGVNYFSVPRRTLSDKHDLRFSSAPDYHLIISLLSPSLLDVSKQAYALIPLQLHWTSRVTASLSRLSGWKDGNALYSHRLPHLC
ncbi:hypothetical protein [Vibrio sp. 10N.261.51.F12]|uniref:hypothetical protein n=1 Tax=Vibrio sp. 10N.261.51.F12 TaxID=3229679 RepID=UPI00354CA725